MAAVPEAVAAPAAAAALVAAGSSTEPAASLSLLLVLLPRSLLRGPWSTLEASMPLRLDMAGRVNQSDVAWMQTSQRGLGARSSVMMPWPELTRQV